MKTTLSKILIVLLVLSSVLTIAASPNDHRIKFTPFSGTGSFVENADPGTIKNVGRIVIGKGMVNYETAIIPDEPRVAGLSRVTVNFVYKPYPPSDLPPFLGTGPVWGSIHLQNDGGEWDIQFSGHQYDGCKTVIHGQGSGEGGYKGLKAVWEWQSTNCMFTSSVSGYIIEHE